MPADRSTESRAAAAQGGGRRGYGLLAAAWLLLLATGGAAVWFVHAGAPDTQPVRSAVLHADKLPDPPSPNREADRSEEVDPRVRQLATRDRLATAPLPLNGAQDPAAAARHSADGTPQAGVVSEETAEAAGPTGEAPDAQPAPGVQVAARTDQPAPQSAPQPATNTTAATGPMPPAVPRAVVAPAREDVQREDLGRYSVQVGAFRLRENAVARAAQLSAAGYDVRIVHAFATHSRLYMVRLGTFDARPAAMAYARQIARDVAVETWPVRN